jgi:hypothetical protein
MIESECDTMQLTNPMAFGEIARSQPQEGP